MSTTLLIEPGQAAFLQDAGLRTFDDFWALRPSGPAASAHWNRRTEPVDVTVRGVARRFFLKRLIRPQPEHVLGDWFRLRPHRAQPLREWHNLQRLEKAGVGVMRRAAAGARTRWGWPSSAFLLVEAVPAAWTVDEWMAGALGSGAPPLPEWMRRRLAVEMGVLARRLDGAGWWWEDLDAKHIFASPAEPSHRGARWQFWLIDVERMTESGPSRDALRTAVAMADLLDPGASRPPAREPGRWDVEVIYGAALGGRGAGRLHRGRICAATSGLLRGLSRQRRRTNREMRDMRGPKPAETITMNDLLVRADHANALQRARIASLDDLLEWRTGDSLHKPGLKDWRRRDRILLPNPLGGDATYYLKRYRQPPRDEQWRRRWAGDGRVSSAMLEQRNIAGLDAAGVPTPGWAAAGERMRGEQEEASALLMPEARGQSLEKWVYGWARSGGVPAPRMRHAIVRELAAITRRMHDAGYCHRDLYLSHVFLEIGQNGPELCLIDLARVTRARRLSFRRRVKDLAALEYSSPRPLVTRSDRMRFLRQYQGSERLSLHRRVPPVSVLLEPAVRVGRRELSCVQDHAWIGHVKWIEAVLRRVERMARHDARHGRSGVLTSP